jgi:hypothetical protein
MKIVLEQVRQHLEMYIAHEPNQFELSWDVTVTDMAKELDGLWDGNGGDVQVDLLEREVCASMSAIVSAAAALDAFYGSVVENCPRTAASASLKVASSL